MKRLLTLIVAISSIFAALAQNPMVTLSHNGELTFFTNLGAFKAAYNAATHGDILYLSEGDFILDGGSITIKKHLSIVGSGYKSHILGDITINLDGVPSYDMNEPMFDGVRLDDIVFTISSQSSKVLGESEIKRSWIRKVSNADLAGTDILYENCFIETMHIYQYNASGNTMIRNSKISSLTGDNFDVTVVNCNIDNASYYPRSMFSSILNNETACSSSGKHSIHNSLLRCDHQSSSVTTYDCYILQVGSLLDDKLEATSDLAAALYFGQDGTVVGIHGGESPFSENPSVPTVDTAKSSVDYDAASNKLKVSITVKAD